MPSSTCSTSKTSTRAARRAPEPQPRRHDARVVHDRELAGEQVRELGERAVLDLARSPARTRGAATRRAVRPGSARSARAEARSRGSQCPSGAESSLAPVDELALERAKQRIAQAAAGRPDPGALEAVLERSRAQVEALAAAAADLEASIPGAGRRRRPRRAPRRGPAGRPPHRRDPRPAEPGDPAARAARGRPRGRASRARGRPRAPRRPRELRLARCRRAARAPRAGAAEPAPWTRRTRPRRAA